MHVDSNRDLQGKLNELQTLTTQKYNQVVYKGLRIPRIVSSNPPKNEYKHQEKSMDGHNWTISSDEEDLSFGTEEITNLQIKVKDPN